MLSIDPIQYGFLYKKSSSSPTSPTTIVDLLEKLTLSLSNALVYFYPLAGQLVTQRFEHEHSCCISIDCRKGPGAKLIHASALDVTLSDVISVHSDTPRVVRSFFDLGERANNHDGHTRSLLSVQVTELRYGIFLGCCVNHCVADGSSFSHFLRVWSDIFMARSTINSFTPVFKSLVPYGYGPTIKLPFVEPGEFITRFDEGQLSERIFHFSRTSMAMIKAKANIEVKSCNTDHGCEISSFQALCGFLWRSITKAQNPLPNEETTCVLIVNLRPRFDPPLSQQCFGNIFGRAKVTIKVSELLEHSFGWATMRLHKAVLAQTDKEAREVFLRSFIEGPKVTLPGLLAYGPNRVVVGGSARFDWYEVDFGLDRPEAIQTGYANKADGKVTALPGTDGGGSVDLQVCLKPETMRILLSDQEFMNVVS